jgi:hypothetical protein
MIENEDEYWEIPDNIDTTNFDFDWFPNPYDPPFIHEFGTQWQKTGGPRFIVRGATEVKYEISQRATVLPDYSKWSILSRRGVDRVEFDYSWHPDSTEPPMNYVFGDQYQSAEEGKVLTYKLGDNLPVKYIDSPIAKTVYRPLDIVFLSNGETNEQERYNRLCEVAGKQVKWVKGINGRERALRHAAEISTTDWFILFPGKLLVDDKFDFDFQPIRHYEPKHYIFYAKNPVNGLEYGHQAAVCYHRQLVLDTIDYGLDFTMSRLHDIVPVISGIAEYNSSVIMTWRTAFREVIKLRADNSEESQSRLNTWLTVARGKHCEWSMIGAEDGVEYYEQVNGEHGELLKSFSWQWLDEYFTLKYPQMKI